MIDLRLKIDDNVWLLLTWIRDMPLSIEDGASQRIKADTWVNSDSQSSSSILIVLAPLQATQVGLAQGAVLIGLQGDRKEAAPFRGILTIDSFRQNPRSCKSGMCGLSSTSPLRICSRVATWKCHNSVYSLFLDGVFSSFLVGVNRKRNLSVIWKQKRMHSHS